MYLKQFQSICKNEFQHIADFLDVVFIRIRYGRRQYFFGGLSKMPSDVKNNVRLNSIIQKCRLMSKITNVQQITNIVNVDERL